MLHARFSNTELSRQVAAGSPPVDDPAVLTFLAWISDKPPDFHAPTRPRR